MKKIERLFYLNDSLPHFSDKGYPLKVGDITKVGKLGYRIVTEIIYQDKNEQRLYTRSNFNITALPY